MKIVTKLPVLIWTFVSLLVYSSVLVSPSIFKYSGVISFGIPIILALNFIILILSIIFKSKLGFAALVLVLIGWPFVQVGISISRKSDQKTEGIRVLNYNVKWFSNARKDNYSDVVEWINKVEADIIAFQEFYPNKGIAKRISDYGGYNISMDKGKSTNAIFSKYPIINDGLLLQKDKLNNIRFVDLIVENDTIRVYGVHLQSMGINPDKIQDSEGIKNEYDDIRSRFVFSSSSRTKQIEILLDHAKKCDYPKMVIGDFNDVPFSYNYFQFKDLFSNAFEEKGRGIGATFNNKIPYLRIDNQFFTKEFSIKSFETVGDIYYSDHFPLIGIYELSN
ncbi:endonuclease/exonuclease/phosphatase family protein [Roseivirga sp.]|uniref:endonuclease/exonuclease/phosphatase family protein n=1 Tax=Roseivirga sp. TaxID=1964215 RepID=UPI003B8BB0A3